MPGSATRNPGRAGSESRYDRGSDQRVRWHGKDSTVNAVAAWLWRLERSIRRADNCMRRLADEVARSTERERIDRIIWDNRIEVK